MKFLRGGTAASSSSIQLSNAITQLLSKATRSNVSGSAVDFGVATAAPASNRRD
eukprot:TRINITY_DN2476_c0_g1_i1.p2 TRINITY_DN2476_c0_g1~~TRINITY_DN2476_c0_g1_i1.p2  ORF type:complete len:54 (+),score=3.04 TRINITY_DN2476_c0_g1_i1:345-506(+)